MGKLAAIFIKLAIAGGSFFGGLIGKLISFWMILWTASDVIMLLDLLAS